MFVGHFGAGIAGKALAPRAPLWVFIGASQLLDFAWAGLIMAGVEKVGFDPALPGSALVLAYMPYTHSLVAAVLWALAAGLLAGRRWPGAGIMVGLVVLSHWGLDYVAHRPDLTLGMAGPRYGLGLWNRPVPEMALEMGLVGFATAMLAAQRVRARRALWPLLLFFTALTGLQIFAALQPSAADAMALGRSALLAFTLVTLLAWAVEWGQRGRR